MEVEHALAGIGSVVDDEAVAVLEAPASGNVGGDTEHLRENRSVLRSELHRPLDVLSRDHEHVGGCLGRRILERDDVVVLEDDGRGDLSRSDPAEYAIPGHHHLLVPCRPRTIEDARPNLQGPCAGAGRAGGDSSPRCYTRGMLRAFFFDFDGTLVDTEPLHLEAFRRVLGPRGITIRDDEYEERYLVGTDRECLERMFVDYDRPDLAPERDSLWLEKRRTMDALLTGAPLFPGARELVTEAAALGPVAVVTGGLGTQVRSVLERAGLLSLFDHVIAAEDVQRGKPDPEGFRLSRERIRRARLPDLRSSECLAVEDSPAGVRAAKEAGMRVLAVTHSTGAGALSEADRVAPGLSGVTLADLEGEAS